ncbi:ribonuclease H-like domain-containing protein [Tanacetum coccineum]|uniref:Ribonuclease H-like domain-containing protein n=1 Tax=Tanacetum coccineum TaxID=301880 RepID=A0ABQ5HCD5_9ASTR
MPRVESIRPSGVIIEDWVSNDEDIFQSNNLQATDKPSFKRIEFTNARNESVKPKQAEKPRINTQNPKNTGQREIRPVWNSAQRINHQNKFVPSVVLTKFGRVPVSATKKSSLRATTSTINTIRVNGVNTAGQTAVSVVKGNRVTAVKVSAGNKDFLIDYQDIDGGFVAFGGSARGVAERKNMTLIEAARTMLADSLLPTVFWDEAVNTACYVLNRVLVTKPHNKTPFELIIGRPLSISFMRPFGCPVTILNTLDPLGKFDGKAEEGFLVRSFRESYLEQAAHNSFNNVAHQLILVGGSRIFGDFGSSFVPLSKFTNLPHDPLMPNLEDTAEVQNTGSFGSAFDDEDLDTYNSPFADQVMGVEADFNHMEPSTIFSPIPTTIVHSIHPKDQMIGDPKSAVQTKGMTKKSSREHAMISYIYEFLHVYLVISSVLVMNRGMLLHRNGYRWQSQAPRHHGGAPAQTRSERVLEQPIEPPLLEGGYTLRSDEGRLKLQELMTMCTKLSKQVLDLEKEKDAQAMEILRLNKRVKRLER